MAGKARNIITLEDAAAIVSDLKELAKKPKFLTIKAVVEQAAPQIQFALQQGYTLEDICEVMGKRNIKISPNTLKQYLGRLEREESRID